jgi:hypothetical protein
VVSAFVNQVLRDFLLACHSRGEPSCDCSCKYAHANEKSPSQTSELIPNAAVDSMGHRNPRQRKELSPIFGDSLIGQAAAVAD